MRDRLIELLSETHTETDNYKEQARLHDEYVADYLLANGVIVTPCVAMVEQFIKNGEFDRKRTAHNGRIAVVYIDKSKWNSPLIDITEQFYNADKAKERIQALKEREG